MVAMVSAAMGQVISVVHHSPTPTLGVVSNAHTRDVALGAGGGGHYGGHGGGWCMDTRGHGFSGPNRDNQPNFDHRQYQASPSETTGQGPQQQVPGNQSIGNNGNGIATWPNIPEGMVAMFQ
jgi:hypothetical protein